jgi:DNA-binding MarR family transcriptional regulator
MSAQSKVDEARVEIRKRRENHNIFARIPAIYAASRKQARQFLQHGGGLTSVEWRTLWDLHEAGPMTIRDLSKIQRADHSLLSRALPDMKRKGYVTMQRSDADGRQTIVALTDAGRAAYQTAAPVMARRRAALRAEFSEDEIAQFAALLDRLEGFLHRPAEALLEDRAPES